MKINKLVAVTSLLGVTLLTGCADNKQEDNNIKDTQTESTQKDEKLKITTTVFPIYDWTKNIVGDKTKNVDIEMLLDSGIDLHSYQPTAQDIITINSSDVFIYVGGVSDSWVEDVLAQSTNEDLVAINLMEVLGDRVLGEELAPGMQESEHNHNHGTEEEHEHEHEDETEEEHEHEHETEKEHEHEHEIEEEHEHEDETEEEHQHEHEHETEEDHDHEHESEEDHNHNHPDEHIWLSLKNASIITEEISQILSEKTGDEVYLKNASKYISEIEELDKKYEMKINEAEINTLLFGDRFPFRYLVEDYGLDYYAAFIGCSAETEASFETITFLSKKVDELGLEAVIELESSGHDIAKTVVNNTKDKDQEILVLDSIQSVSEKDIQEGTSYMSIMESNLEVIENALDKDE